MTEVIMSKFIAEGLKREADSVTDYQLAVSIAIALSETWWPELGELKIEPDLRGVLLQIDNMTAGMVRPDDA